MLQCTPTAVMTLRQLGRQEGVPANYGLRVSASATSDGQPALAISFVEQPAEGDQVDEQHGTRIFVAREIADQLSEYELDLNANAAANGTHPPELVLRDGSASATS